MVLLEKQNAVADPADSRMRRWTWVAAAVFAGVTFWISASRWASFSYRTFDVAFYIQALFEFVRGNAGTLSLLNVPMLGNHADLIVFLLAPLWAVYPHPLWPVAVQIAAMATMAPVGYRMARRFGLEPEPAALMALAILAMPATGFVAVHEFHPEALVAPFLLLAIDGFQRQSRGRFWFWFLATLACKENTTLLLAAWGVVNAWKGWSHPPGGAQSRREKLRWIAQWSFAPTVVALGWAALYGGVLSPRWNAGNVDFGELYAHWARAPWSELPHELFVQLSQSLRGNLWPGLLLPLCGLSLLRPAWLWVAAPVAAQHLLSWRNSEWNLFFHYPAPFLPLVWVAACEAVAGFRSRRVQRALACSVGLACAAGLIWLGPLILRNVSPISGADAAQIRAELATIPRDASVAAGLPFLSHLAEREHLYSLHLILKGIKVLSEKPCPLPPLADVVVVDYTDTATFDTLSGYYHPVMRTREGVVIPSSDQLFHRYLRQGWWDVESRNSLTVFRRRPRAPPSVEETAAPPDDAGKIGQIDPATRLLHLSARPLPGRVLEVETHWRFEGERKAVPWMALRLIALQGGAETWLDRGLCAPEGWNNGAVWADRWQVALPSSLTPGMYRVEVLFFDQPKLRCANSLTSKSTLPIFRWNLQTLQVP